MNAQQLSASSVLVAIFLSGCATTPPTQPIPELSQPQSAGLGIDVTLKAIIAAFSYTPDQIYFAKIDGKDSLLQQQIIPSNYAKGGRAYLLNARPGTYVAVAAFFSYTPMLGGKTTQYTTYLSKELVEQTKVTVRENDFVFMGSYVVQQSLGGPDKVQTHYQNLLAPGVLRRGFGVFNPERLDYHYRGVLIEHKSDEQTRNEFFRNAKVDFEGSAWVERLK